MESMLAHNEGALLPLQLQEPVLLCPLAPLLGEEEDNHVLCGIDELPFRGGALRVGLLVVEAHHIVGLVPHHEGVLRVVELPGWDPDREHAMLSDPKMKKKGKKVQVQVQVAATF